MKDNFEGTDQNTPSSSSSTYQSNSDYGYNPNAYNPADGQNNQYVNGGYYSTGQPNQSEPQYNGYNANQSEPQYNGYNTNQDLGQQANPYVNNQQPYQGYSPYQSGNAPYEGYQQNPDYNNQYMNQQFANQQYDPNNYGSGMQSDYNQVNSELSPKKKSHKALWGLTAIPVLAIALVVAFFFIPSFQNFVYKNVLGTKKYYAHIESSCDEKIANEFNNAMSKLSTDSSNEASCSGTISLSLNSALTEELGFDPADFTCDFTSAAKDNQATSSTTFKYQGTELLAIEYYADLDKDTIYLKLPTFSDKYIDYTSLITQLYSSDIIDSDLSSSLLNLSATNTTSSEYADTIQQITQKLGQELDSDTVSKLLSDYTDYLLDEIKEYGTVELNEETEFVVSGSKQKCDAFTLSVSEEDTVTIIKDVLNKLKTDETILTICKNVMGTDYMYTSALEELLSELDDADDIDKDNDSFLNMTVYTDGDEILGRKFTFAKDEEEISFLYGMLSSDDACSFVFELRDPTDSAVGISMDADKKDNTYDGTINFYAEDETYSMTFTGMGITDDDLLTGSLRIPVDSDELTLDLSADNGKQNVKIGVKQSGTELGALSISIGKDETTNFNYPDITEDSIAQFTDSASIAAYFDADKLETFIQTIYDTFNLPLTVSAKDLADQVITSIANGTFFSNSIDDGYNDYYDDYYDDYNDYYGDDNSDSSNTSGSYNPEDYDLPAGTEIDEYGYYMYDLSAEDLEALKQQGSDYNALSKTYTEMQSYFNQIATTFCGTADNVYSTEYNYVSGYVTDNSKNVYHKTNITWYSDSYNSVNVYYDTLTNQLLSITIVSTDTDSLLSYITDIYSKLEITALPEDTMNAISTALKANSDFNEEYTFSDSYIDIYNYGQDDNGKNYYTVTIQKDSTYY